MLKQKWIVTLVGLIALSILIWFVGPYIAIADVRFLESQVVRLLVIMVLLLVWGLNNLRLTMAAKSGNEKLAADLQTDGGANEPHGALQNENEVALISNRFKDALETLKRSSASNTRYSKNYLYELPWYLLIGPPGSGKTTALVNSGLNFPLEDTFGKGSIKGVGGTRHCDWWFTDQAVIIDTAGRYTTQDSHAVADSKAWKGFIGLLKRYRKRRPINGVLVTIGLDELQRQTQAELSANVNAIRARLQELTDQLGVNFPVYLVLTKCDLIPGFTQYFDMMGKEERAQVWGMTFPDQLQAAQTYPQLFDGEYDLLAQRLEDNVLSKFHFERDVKRRAEILGFPAAFQKLKPVFHEFLQQTFSESRFHNQFQLRGVYFASGTQQAAGMQRMMQSMAGQMGVSADALVANDTQGKSFFLRNLFQQVIFPEAELVGTNRRYETKLRAARSVGYGASCVAAVGAAVLWSTSYGLNESRLNSANETLALYLDQRSGLRGSEKPEKITEQLETVLTLQSVFNPEQDDWAMGLGLYQGQPIHEKARNQYQRALIESFYPAIQNQLAWQLTQNRDEPEYLHHGLKAYLMLSLPERLDKEYVAAWLRADWQNRFAQQPEQLQKLNYHLEQLLAAQWPALGQDEFLVGDTRRILKQVPLARQIYGSIKEKAQQKVPLQYRFDTEIGHDIHYVFSGEFKSIPWLFTAEGYHDFFKPQQKNIIEELADDSWVVGNRSQDMSDLDLANVQAQIEKRYLDDYIGYWQDAINQLQLKRSKNLDEHVRLLSEILSGSSPLHNVLQQTAVHTQLSQPLVDPAQIAEQMGDAGKLAQAASPKVSRLNRIASLAGRNRLMKLPENPATLVDTRFEAIHDLMGGGKAGTVPYDRIRSGLLELQFYLEGITSSGNQQEAAFDAATSRMANGRSDPIGKLKLEARYLPEPVKAWVTELVDGAWSHVLVNARSHLSSEYALIVKPYYQRSIDGRYPINKQASVDVTLDDFAEFFKPGGIEHQFFQNYLAPFVNTQRSPWKAKYVDGQSLGLSKRSLGAFEQAAQIRKVMFASSDVPSVGFKLRATYLDANINRFELNMLGERLEYRHGPARKNQVSWPSDLGVEAVKYTFEDHYGVQFSGQEQGVWALFRFLDRYPLAKTGYADRFTLTVKDKERKAIYELHANSAVNPFGRDYLSRYRLPSSL